MRWLLSLLHHRAAPVRFVQVGAHDGSSKSPLLTWRRDEGWTGLMIEPVPSLFAQLQANLGHLPGMILENAAIGKTRGRATFYGMRPAASPALDRFSMLGSFRKDVILKHRIQHPEIEEHIEELEVECWPLMDLLAKHDLLAAQVLVIDTEGFDHEILTTIDFATFSPSLVIYEYKHLGSELAMQSAALLRRHGYYVLRADDEDAVAIHPRLIPADECEILARPLLEHDSLMRLLEISGTFSVHHKPQGGMQVRRIA